jgi:hypothetical protein
MLDEALGPGTGEGTLHQSARIRTTVDKEWANAAQRPWALTSTPYNSRAEVDAGLREWARGNGARARLLRRIRALYPGAERDLAAYYARRRSGRSGSPSALARKALDHMFRTYFVFSKNAPAGG